MTGPLILLHGFTGSPDSWGDVIDHLGPVPDAAAPGTLGATTIARATAPTTRAPIILAPTALGHDGTPGPADVTTFGGVVDRLAAVIRSRVPGPAQLVGYSMGGRIALGLLVRHPELFAAATLIGASPGLATAGERQERVEKDEEWARLLDEEGLDTFVAAWEALPLWSTQAAIPGERLERQRAIRRAHDPRGLARSLRVVGLGRMPDYRPLLADVDLPVRLVVGARDPKFRALAEEMAARLPRATVTAVPGAGHNVVLERPREIAELLREDRIP
ncbi:MAG: alpha/beta fold hydrolase [Candidatus Longimicrobiales bacterium M2_2A_002]